ncbi:hypothetical protein PPL_04760 [Heterostelium album PN500]|uniref:Uncharacterized protein n=1 Tax=Heterostelium pallidum (strain ATCC 26659 / Pp 5 / PN500) TaxID=670386 RepID=D3B8G7_HETP5|nr:hypothetical protein PPL_04760 [Heterostelium album PN500]EFA82335.1 hypothetical protein PPL_04760 [Heterostelium album PN500]|eukprot:XP_020434452.1 hypothetical protein PPL_04760 [Heterostelium album PN500]
MSILQNIAILDPLKQKLYLAHIFLTILFSPLIIAAICSNWYTIGTPDSDLYFGLFSYTINNYDNPASSSSGDDQTGIKYSGLSIRHTFGAVAAFEILSIIPLLMIYYGHFKLFYKTRNTDRPRKMSMYYSVVLFALQFIGFLCFFSITILEHLYKQKVYHAIIDITKLIKSLMSKVRLCCTKLF